MDLHSGLPYWIVKNPLFNYYHPLRENHTVDVAIIGSGITGALVAHELCKAGIACSVFDKRSIATGSSAASTAQLQYEIDTPLCRLAEMNGIENAVLAYHASLQSISDVEQVLKATGAGAGFSNVSSIFLASDRKGLRLIEEEYALRQKYSLPVHLLDSGQLADNHRIHGLGALKNNEAAQMDGYSAAVGILSHHMQHNGLQLFTNTEIKEYKESQKGYTLLTGDGHTIDCRYLVIAAGFEAGQFLPRNVMQLSSTYALVSDPVDEGQLWPERSLVWETAQPYFYMRTTQDNRMMIGGADEPFKDPDRRDKLLRKKVKVLEQKFKELYPGIPFYTDMAWCGTFSSTKDGLPYIGPWPGKPGMFFALGYGGNGITFSMIAAQVIRNMIKGNQDTRAKLFGFDRH